MSFSSDLKVVISKDVLSQEVNGEMVLLDLSSETYFGLDETGARIWELFAAGKSQDEILAVLLDEYDVDRPQLEADVSELLGRLLEAGLVHIETMTE
jgi:hypothetical protein